MTEKGILELEKDNYTTIHLHLVGIFWRAMENNANNTNKSHSNNVRCVLDECYLEKICKLCLLLFFLSFNLSAQTVTIVSSYPVIDLSALVPRGTVLSSAEASAERTTMNEQTPSNTAYLGVGRSVSDHNGSWNAKMSIKYQVMRRNNGAKTDWATAYNLCKSYAGEGGSAGQWRLPTQLELQKILMLHSQLIGQGGFTAFTVSDYWSATEYNASEAWSVCFNTGIGYHVRKAHAYYVRCIKDL